MLLNQLIAPNAVNFSEKPAVTFNSKDFTYETIINTVLSLSVGLQSNLNVGEPIIVCLPNSLEMLYFFLACLNTGILFIPLSEHSSPEEIKLILEISKANTIVLDFNKLQSLQKIGFIFPKNVYFVGEKKLTNKLKAMNYKLLFQNAEQFKLFRPEPDQPAMVITTSGSTGKPKCVLIPYRNAIILPSSNRFPINPNSILLLTSSMQHGSGLFQILQIFSYGARLILLSEFDAELVIKEISRHKVTLLSMNVYSFYEMLHCESVSSEAITTLECCVTWGDIAPVELKRKFYSLTGNPLISLYGMTETGPCIYNDGSRKDKLGALGQIIQGVEIKLLTEEGSTVNLGQIGEIWCKTPRIMLGYLNNPSLTSQALINGWFRTGDLAYKDEDDYYWFAGRLKHLVVLPSGDNVSPIEIENVINQHPSVKMSCVVGLPDESSHWKKLAAFIVLRDGKYLSDIQLYDYLENKLSAYKIPKSIYFVDSLPLTKTGKIDRNQLTRLNTN